MFYESLKARLSPLGEHGATVRRALRPHRKPDVQRGFCFRLNDEHADHVWFVFPAEVVFFDRHAHCGKPGFVV